MQAKNIVIVVLSLVLIGAVSFLFLKSGEDTTVVNDDTTATDVENIPVPSTDDIDTEPVGSETTEEERGDETVIGTSVDGNDITAYHFGTGDTELLFIGGVHGGYSWNTALVGYELVDYLDANPNIVPGNITVTVIPVLNPDGLKATVGTDGRFKVGEAETVSEATRVAGRFNANNVDRNRNFDCEWSETGTWQSRQVSGGTAPFSEPEAAALHDYISTNKPTAAVVWFSSEGKVYPSACGKSPSKESIELTATFATAAGYGAAAEFNAYTITGDMVNWMAKQDIPAISVLLTDYKNTEWNKNRAGIEAVINAYAE